MSSAGCRFFSRVYFLFFLRGYRFDVRSHFGSSFIANQDAGGVLSFLYCRTTSHFLLGVLHFPRSVFANFGMWTFWQINSRDVFFAGMSTYQNLQKRTEENVKRQVKNDS
jgi:hypothetical protein